MWVASCSLENSYPLLQQTTSGNLLGNVYYDLPFMRGKVVRNPLWKNETALIENDKMKRMKPSPGKNFANSKRANQGVCAKIYPFLLLRGIFSGNKLCKRKTRFLQEETIRHNYFYSIVRAHVRTTTYFHSNIPSQ